MKNLKTRSGEPQEAFVRAVYAEMLLDKAEGMIAKVYPTVFDLEDIENPNDQGGAPSAWNLRCFQDSFEGEVIKRDLFSRLSAEAKEVLNIFLNTPAEVTEALLDICVGHEPGNPREYNKRKSLQYIYKPQRVKNYLRRFCGWNRWRIERAFKEIRLFVKETMI